MTAFDYTVIVIIAVSVLLGWWRGLMYEALSLAGWVAAYFMARWLASTVAIYIPASVGTQSIREMIAFAGIFIATLMVSAIVAWVVSKLVKLAQLGWVDGFFGALFGLLRGGLLVLILVLLASRTSVTKESFWREARLSKPLETIAITGSALLPDTLARHVGNGLEIKTNAYGN